MSQPADEILAPEALRGRVLSEAGLDFRSSSARELLEMELPPRREILKPVLPEKGIALLYGYRGVGKTYCAMEMACAVAAGGEYLRFRAPEPRRVLYIDGEMPAQQMQERFATIINADVAVGDNLRIFLADLHLGAALNLADTSHQDAVEGMLDDADLIVVDNISTLCRYGNENDADSWEPIQAWALRQRAAGRTVLFIHHAGKGGQQRGTSKREDVLDTVIKLDQPQDYTPQDGARFEIHFEKHRGFYGDDAAPLEATLIATPGNPRSWQWQPLEESSNERVRKLRGQGLTQKEIVTETGLSKGYVSKLYRRDAKGDRYRNEDRR